METLKKIYSNLKTCSVKGEFIEFNDILIDGNQVISFPTPKSKDYNLKSVVVFLLNSDVPLKEYVKICKQNEASPVSHVDKSSIISDIESFKVKKVDGFFIWPDYVDEKFLQDKSTSNKASVSKYTIPSIRERNIILVPYSLTSKIHIDNIVIMLTTGRFENSTANPLSAHTRSIQIKDKNFIITNDISSLNVLDQESIKAIFIESSDSTDIKRILSICPPDTAIFSTKDESFRFLKLELSQNCLRNYEQIIQKLLN